MTTAARLDRYTKDSAMRRIEWIDIVKGVLIILVVFGHFILKARHSHESVSTVFNLIYLFHMPAFVFVSGLLAKHAIRNGRLNPGRPLLYIVIAVLFNCAVRASGGGQVTFDNVLIMPAAPWYLASLASWLILIPLFDAMKPLYGICISILVSLISTSQENAIDFLAISRTMHFLPYFMAGYYCSFNRLEALRKGRARIIAIVLGVLATLIYISFKDHVNTIFFMVEGNNDCNIRFLDAIPAYFELQAYAIVLSGALIAAVPNKCALLSFLGQRTLQIYIIHRVVRGFLTAYGMYDCPVLMETGVSVFVSMSLLTLIVTSISCLPFVTFLSKRILDIKLRWLER